jgi:hypothetical protein
MQETLKVNHTFEYFVAALRPPYPSGDGKISFRLFDAQNVTIVHINIYYYMKGTMTTWLA